MSGAGYRTPYQYLGMENNGFAYYGGGHYYSPIMGRMLSLQSPLSSSGGRGSGVAPVAAALGALSPDGPGGVPGSPFYNLPAAAAPAYWGSVGAGAGYGAGELIAWLTAGEFGGGPPGAVIGGVIGALSGLFEGLFAGGSSGPPPWDQWKLNHRGGDLQEWAQIDGIDPAWAPSWAPTGGIELTQGSAQPEYRKYVPASGSVSFWACEGTLLAFSAPTVVACGVSGSLCVGGGVAACGVAFGTCGAEFFGALSCYSQAHGGSFPNPGDEMGQTPPGNRLEPVRPEPPLDEAP